MMTEYEDFSEWLEKLKNENKPIIVEGESDKEALEKLGIPNVISLSRKNLDEFVEHLNDKEVILLMDYDFQGKKLTKEISKLLEIHHIKYNLDFWKMLPRFKVAHVEGIFTRFNKLKQER